MKFLNKIYATAGLTIFSGMASAASLLPEGVFTGVKGDATDTLGAVMLAVIPIGVAVAVGKAALGWSKGGTSKALR